MSKIIVPVVLACVLTASSCITTGSALAKMGNSPTQNLAGEAVPANKCASKGAVVVDVIISALLVGAGTTLFVLGDNDGDVADTAYILGSSTLLLGALPYTVGTGVAAGLTFRCHARYRRRVPEEQALVW